MTRKNFDPPSEPPDGVPNCHEHGLPMEWDDIMGEYYCPNSHYEDVINSVFGEESYQEPDVEACYQNVTARYVV